MFSVNRLKFNIDDKILQLYNDNNKLPSEKVWSLEDIMKLCNYQRSEYQKVAHNLNRMYKLGMIQHFNDGRKWHKSFSTVANWLNSYLNGNLAKKRKESSFIPEMANVIET
jgi:hypothetical protein